MNQENIEVCLVLYCLVLPFILLLPKIGFKVKSLFRLSKLNLFFGLLLFSILPIFYDYFYNNLSWKIILRLIYVFILFLSLTFDKLNNLKYSHFIIYLFLFIPLYFDILPGGIIKIKEDILIKTNVIGTIPLCFYLYLVVHPIDEKLKADLGTTITFKSKHFVYTFIGAIILTLTVLPTSIYLNFVRLKSESGNLFELFSQFLIYMLAVGIPEEMFFRVIFYYILKKYNPFLSVLNYILLSSLFFGIAHIFTPTPGHPTPNWIYAILASMFGLMYSYIYIKTNQLFHAAFIHALVDSIWLHWFML